MPKASETVALGNWMREDEWEIDFDDTRAFTADRWSTANDLFRLSKADRSLAGHVTTHKAFDQYMKEAASSSTNAFQLAALQSITQIYRALLYFENIIKDSVDDDKVDTSGLWAMAYLNIKLSIDSSDKLKRTTRWMTDLRRKIELFNRCVEQCDNANSMRMEMSEIFSPLLAILHESIRFLQRHNADDDFVKNWGPKMEPKLKDYFENMEGTIKHLKSMGTTSKINQAQATNYVELGLRDRDVEKDGAEKAVFPVQCLPAFHTKFFTGRDKEIDSIHDRLGSTEVNRLQSYLIYGRRGIGKTQIALEYSRRYKESYDAIFWIQCETSASLRTSFAEIAVALELDGADKDGHFEENLMKVLGWLRRTRKRWLLIYDNAERGQLLKGYWPVGARGSILLTSRTFYNFFDDEQRHGETVPLFNEEERWDLLMAHLGTEWEARHFAEGDMMVEVEKAAAKTLLDKTGGLPLAITHAASLIKNPHVGNAPGNSSDTSIRGFLEVFRESHKTLPERQSGPREPLFHSLDTIWSIAFNALSSNARALLGVLALLSPDLILIDLFQPSDQGRLTDKLAFCRTGSGDVLKRPQIQSVIQPSIELQKAIEELETSAFVYRIGREMRIHREVQEAVNYQGSQDLKDCFDATVNLVYDAFPKQEGGRPLSDQWDSCQRSIQHAIHLANKFSSYAKERLGADAPLKNLSSTDVLLRLVANCAWYLFEIADYDECLHIIQIACTASKDPTSTTYAHLLNTRASAYYELNRLTPSRQAIETALSIRHEVLPENDPEIAISLANLGNVEAAEGNLDEALVLFQEAADIRESLGDSAATMLGLNYLQLGRVFFQKGEHDRAYDLYQRSEGIFNKRVGRNRNYTADLHYAYGNLEFAKGNYFAAGRAYELCRRISMDYNPLHPLTSAACYKLACAEFEQNHHKKALNLLEKALEIADIRSAGIVDGTCARIMWKRAEVLLDEPVATRRDEGHRLMTEVELRQTEIAEKLGVDLRLDELQEGEDKEKTFDLLVPGYFR